MLDKIRKFVRQEPVRVAVHGLVITTVAAAVASGKIDAQQGDLLTVALLWVLFGAGAEAARSQVRPTVKDE